MPDTYATLQPYQLNALICQRTGEAKMWLTVDELLKLIEREGATNYCIDMWRNGGDWIVMLELYEPHIKAEAEHNELESGLAMVWLRVDDERRRIAEKREMR